MDFDLSPEQSLLQEAVRDFVKRECTPEVMDECFRLGHCVPGLWRRLADAGWLGISLPEEYGGSGGDILDLTLVTEQLARAGPVMSPYLASSCFGGKTIGLFGSEEQKREFIPRLAAGELVFALSISEPGGGTDVLGAMTTRADPDGDGWVLNGQKMWTSNAQVADYLVVVARTTPRGDVDKPAQGVSVFLVPSDLPGITLQKVGTVIHHCDTNLVYYDDVKVPATALLGERDRGFYQLLSTLNNERILVAARCLGIAQAAFEEAAAYAKERHAFGKPIGQLMAVQHFLADMATEIEASRLLTYRAAWLQSRGRSCGLESTMAKMYAAEAGFRACDQAVQIHGGMGLVEDSPIQRWYREIRLFRIAPLNNEACRNMIAEQAAGLPRSF